MTQETSDWLPIESAPKDAERVLVNDTNSGVAPWVAATWLECQGFSGWVYEDEVLQDCYPLGPKPTHWYNLPPPPGQNFVQN